MTIRSKILLSLILYMTGLIPSNLSAQEKIILTGSAPRVVELGEYFRLSYVVNSKGKSFTGPEFQNFLFSGPMLSTNMSTQIVAGKATRSTRYTYNYTVQAQKEGKFEIPPAKVTVNGKVYTSNRVKIEVIKSNPARSRQQTSAQNQANQKAAGISDEDLFVRVILNKKSVYKGEQVLATIKVYTRVNLSRFGDIKIPSYQGFWSQEIPGTEQVNLVRENYKGSIYNVGTIKKTILVPQQTGVIEIEPFELECFVNKKSQSRSMFDDFFGSYETSRKMLISPALSIQVKDLPAGTPESFTGAVGQFTLSSSIDKTQLKANEAISYRIKIKGKGNFKLIDPPSVEFPVDFELYDPKLIDNFSTRENGISGDKSFEYLVIPRFGGSFTIPEVKFSYFDPASGVYKTLSTRSYNIEVGKADNEEGPSLITRSSGTEVRMLGQDIRFIKTGAVKLRKPGAIWTSNSWFYVLYLIILLSSILGAAGLISWQKSRADIAGIKNRQAGRIGQKRLKNARVALKHQNKEVFLNEVLKAMWGYLGDKFFIDPSGFRRELIQEYFDKNNIDMALLNRLFELLDQCEYIRYAPGKEAEELDQILLRSETILNDLEKNIGKRKKK